MIDGALMSVHSCAAVPEGNIFGSSSCSLLKDCENFHFIHAWGPVQPIGCQVANPRGRVQLYGNLSTHFSGCIPPLRSCSFFLGHELGNTGYALWKVPWGCVEVLLICCLSTYLRVVGCLGHGVVNITVVGCLQINKRYISIKYFSLIFFLFFFCMYVVEYL